MFTRTLSLAAVLVGVLLVSRQLQPQAAAPFADQLPAAGCQAFAAFHGLSGQEDAWEATAARQALVKSGFMKSVNRYIERQLIRKAPDRDRTELEYAKAQFDEVAPWLIANGGAVGVWVDPAEPKQPLFAVLLPQPQTVANYLRGFFETPELRFDKDAGYLPVGNGAILRLDEGVEAALLPTRSYAILTDTMEHAEKLRTLLAAGGPTIAGHPSYPVTDSASVLAAGFANFAGVKAQFAEERVDGSNSPTVAEVFDALSLSTVQDSSFLCTMEGEVIRSVARVNTDGQPEGPAKIKLNSSLTLADLPPIPDGTPGFAISRIKGEELAVSLVERMIPVVRQYADEQDDSMPKTPEEFFELFDQGFDEGSGANLQPLTKLLPAMGDLIGVYDNPGGGLISVSMTLFVSVKDRATLRDAIGRLLPNIPEREAAVTTEETDEYDLFTITPQGSPISFVGGISDDWAILGGDVNGVKEFFARVSSREGVWTPSADDLVRNPGLSGEFLSMRYVNTPVTWERGVMYTNMGLPIIGGATGISLPPVSLPATSSITKPMFPNITIVTGSDDGVVSTTNASAPGFPLGSSVSVGIAPFLAGAALLAPAAGQARDAARKTEAKNNIKQLALGTWNYHDTHLNFPIEPQQSGSKPEERLSINYELLPFIDQMGLYRQIDATKSWNDLGNRQATTTQVDAFQHPMIDPDAIAVLEDGATITVTAAPTYFIGNGGVALPGEQPQAGVFSSDGKKLSEASIKDGTSNTIMYFESSKPGDWAQGGRDTIRALTAKPYVKGADGIGGISKDSFQVGMTDGTARTISNAIDPGVLRALMTSDGRERVGEF